MVQGVLRVTPSTRENKQTMTQLTDKDHKAQISGQQQIDLRIQQMELDDQETMTIEEAREMTHRAVSREYALDRDMTPEQLYAVISEEIDDIYANG